MRDAIKIGLKQRKVNLLTKKDVVIAYDNVFFSVPNMVLLVDF